MIIDNETICAPATSGGAIAIIRISGPSTIEICSHIFSPADKRKSINDLKRNSVVYGEIIDGKEIIDDVLVTIFREPHSYTGEDSVEISCHGSAYIQKRILKLLLRNGAVAAQPGEFTRRAFMNGKMDLSQAEAVADLVASTSEASHRIAVNQIRGGFSKEIANLRDELLHFASMIELELDFGEEDVEFADRKELSRTIGKVKEVASNLASSFITGNAIKNGVPVAIAGKPNSGKSTLLNALLMEDKAIVSEIPGTTRDAIEDTIVIEGIEFRFIDTAGIRETSDVIENIGIRKTHEKIGQASIILFIDDISDSAIEVNLRAENIRRTISGQDKRLIVLINKIDLADDETIEELQKNIKIETGESLLFISARDTTGLEELRNILSETVEKERLRSGDVIITNIRHYDALIKVSDSLKRAEEGLLSGIPEDLIAIDIRQAIHYLGEITGEITSDEILGNIFKNFCIGK